MLSILIPVYNFDVRGLVSDLLTQMASIDIPIEICLLDDGSESLWQRPIEELAELEGVSLHTFLTNQGRVASRTKLAELAQYDHLLFIDCDATVVCDDFIERYLNNLKEADVIAGGHVYQKEVPSDKYKLHWKYGREVEVRTLAQRIKNPYNSFSTFNFCLTKEVFDNYVSSIIVQGYGHEDTMIGWKLKDNDVHIKHISNPLLHAGLKEADQFLIDTTTAVKNAYAIVKANPDIKIKIIKYSNVIQNLGLDGLVRFVLNLFENKISSNLKSANPNLVNLQLFKLKVLLELKKNNNG